MDEDIIGTSNSTIVNSFHDYKVTQATVFNLNKKRKLENDQLCVPQSKYKFGCKRSGCENEQPIEEESDGNEMRKGKRVAELDENENTLEPEYPSPTFTYMQSCTSSGSCSSNSMKETLHYSRIINKEPNNVYREDQEIVTGVAEFNRSNVMGRLQFGKKAQLLEDQLEQFEEYAKELDDMIICSKGPSETDHFMLSSGKWCINQEEQEEPRGPTIDQEFEQYFSTLLL
ncbi:protein FAR-RED ELONGATED HYPOCOTYL 1-like [Telopea speciosissima]|uniref:protein FAR-RED ELONGATED HYPOCOTYL 1-like n=1 Tax=Telopea speciosissima TaxID=54955 RepID=UPI001CC45D37|nr:protein FAR-RED ELONGATED HYPOCOTYL 1-like [Telopea speciosissima]